MNILPGQGLGFTGSQLLGFGMAPLLVTEVHVDTVPVNTGGGGGGGNGFERSYKDDWRGYKTSPAPSIQLTDNLYSQRSDDNEIIELISIFFEVIQ